MRFKFNRGLPWDAEIKASDLVRGKGDFVGWHRARREAFLLDLLNLIGLNHDIMLPGVAIDKRKVNVTAKQRMVRPEVRSLELLLERYNHFLEHQQDLSGIVIVDSVDRLNDDNLRYFQSFLQAQSPHLKPLHIVESTFFAKSHTSSMIQIADICANVLYRELAHGKGTVYHRAVYPRSWRHKGRVQGYGIKVWP